MKRSLLSPAKNTICCYAIALAASQAAHAVPVEWPVAAGGNNHLYDVLIFPGSISWGFAELDATQRGGHLATITSAAENDFIFQNLLLPNPNVWFPLPNFLSGPWIGGQQLPNSVEPDQGFEWITGEPFVYTNWRDGEPSNNGPFGAEDVIHFFTSNTTPEPTWNDADARGTTRRGGVVAYVLEIPVPEPSAMVLALLGATCFASRRRGKTVGRSGCQEQT